MRELARVAAAGNWTQEALARAYADAAGVEVNGGNVARHFRSANPQRETIETYRKLLRVAKDHLRLARGEPLTEAEMRAWRDHLKSELAFRLNRNEAVKVALAALEALPLPERERALRTYALTTRRDALRAADPAEGRLSPALAAIRPYLAHAIDLPANLRTQSQIEGFLVSTWSRARAVGLDDARVDALVSVARSFAAEAGLDVATMDERLHEARKKGPSYFQLRANLANVEDK